jgi:hypothetical protein
MVALKFARVLISFIGSVGSDATPQTVASRVVYGTTYLTALALFMAYSAIFISFLAVRRYDLPFTDFSGLVQDGTYRLGVLSGSARVDFFKVLLGHVRDANFPL